MLMNSLTAAEIAELNRYSVWLARLSKSLSFMQNLVDTLPLTPQKARKYTVQERNKMLRLALEDLKVEKENINHAIEGLQGEYQSASEEFVRSEN